MIKIKHIFVTIGLLATLLPATPPAAPLPDRSPGNATEARYLDFLRQAASFRHDFPEDGASLRISKLFAEVPAEDLPRFNAALTALPDTGPEFKVDALFHLKGRATFEPPLLAVSFWRQGRLPEDELTRTARLYPVTESDRTDWAVNATYPSFRTLAVRLEAADRSLSVSIRQERSPTETLRADHLIRLTAHGYVLVSFVCREEEYDVYRELAEVSLTSLTLTPENRWESGQSPDSPGIGTPSAEPQGSPRPDGWGIQALAGIAVLVLGLAWLRLRGHGRLPSARNVPKELPPGRPALPPAPGSADPEIPPDSHPDGQTEAKSRD